jgi:hypothetical protein
MCVIGTTARSMAGITKVGKMPSRMHDAASNASGAWTPARASVACAAPSDRGMPRNPMAKTLAKQVTASPAVNVNSTLEMANATLMGADDRTADRSIVCSVNHSLTRPFSGANAEMDKTPTRKKALVQGILRTMPPRRSRSRVPVPASTAPVPTNGISCRPSDWRGDIGPRSGRCLR